MADDFKIEIDCIICFGSVLCRSNCWTNALIAGFHGLYFYSEKLYIEYLYFLEEFENHLELYHGFEPLSSWPMDLF